MDTEGLYDLGSEMKCCTKIFALSTLMSTVQIYNVMGKITQVDVENLKVCVYTSVKEKFAKPLSKKICCRLWRNQVIWLSFHHLRCVSAQAMQQNLSAFLHEIYFRYLASIDLKSANNAYISPVGIACRFQDRGCVVLSEIDILFKHLADRLDCIAFVKTSFLKSLSN